MIPTVASLSLAHQHVASEYFDAITRTLSVKRPCIAFLKDANCRLSQLLMPYAATGYKEEPFDEDIDAEAWYGGSL